MLFSRAVCPQPEPECVFVNEQLADAADVYPCALGMHRASAETAHQRVWSRRRAAIKLVTIFDRSRRRRRLLIKLVGARLSEADETAARRRLLQGRPRRSVATAA